MPTTSILEILHKRYIIDGAPPSLSEYGQPAYRGVNGNKCSIGCLIDDSIYRRKFEGLDVLTLIDRFPYILTSLEDKGLYPLDYGFLQSIQEWHDIWYVKHYATSLKL